LAPHASSILFLVVGILAPGSPAQVIFWMLSSLATSIPNFLRAVSVIAQEVTGSKWNGFLFIGIADGAAKGGSRKPERRNK